MERKQVNFRLSEEQRDRWDAHVAENPLYDKLSDLIKIAVRNQIERDTGGASDAAQTAAGGTETGEVLTRVNDLEGQIQGLQDAVAAVEDAVKAKGGVSDAATTEVIQALTHNRATASTPEDIADETGRPVKEVELALTTLRQETGVVDIDVRDDGTPIYWRTDDEW